MKSDRIDAALVSKVLILLSCLALLFAVAVWVLFDWRYSGSEKLEPIIFALPEAIIEEEAGVQYVNAGERPLFWPTRRPAASVVSDTSTVAMVPKTEDIEFLGVITTAKGKSRVMLSDGQTSETLLIGEKFRDWVVKEIKQNSVLLVSGEAELVLPKVKDNSAVIDISRIN